MFKKNIAVRNLDENLYEKLVTLSGIHCRSLEGEVRFAIQQWVKSNEKLEDVIHPRISELSIRLQDALNQYNQLASRRNLSLSQIAEELGLDKASKVYNWFQAREEADFNSLKNISTILGCQSDWLIHNEGSKYKKKHFSTIRNPYIFTKQLLTQTINGKRITKIHFFRVDDGRFYILSENENNAEVLYQSTSYSISLNTGSSGSADLMALIVALQILDKITGQVNIRLYSYEIERELFNQNQDKHPLYLTQIAQKSLWHEDIWDTRMFHNSYFDGFTELAETVHKRIQSNDFLMRCLQVLSTISIVDIDELPDFIDL